MVMAKRTSSLAGTITHILYITLSLKKINIIFVDLLVFDSLNEKIEVLIDMQILCYFYHIV